MKNLIRVSLMWLTLVACAVMVLPGCGNNLNQDQGKTVTIPVQVINPGKLDYQEILTFPGITMPPVVTTTAFLVPGKIQRLSCQPGERVTKGQLIAELDPATYENQLNTSAAGVKLAEANLSKVNAGAREQEKVMVAQQLLQAQHSLELAQTEKQRFESLYKIDAIPKRQYDSIITQFNLSKDQVVAAQKRLELIKEGASREDKQIARANVALAASGQASASTQLSYTRLYSPIDGVIAEKKVEVGVVVGAGTAIYEICATGSMDMIVMIPSIHLSKIYLGQPAQIVFPENEAKMYNAVVYEIKPASEMPTRSYRVRLKIADSQYLKSYTGNIGKAIFATGKKTSAGSVPLACLQKSYNDKIYHIFIIKENLAHKIPVAVLKLQDDQALISGNFTSNSQIVISGQDYLQEGSSVKIVDALDSQKFVSPDKEPVQVQSGVKL